jgi:hypothetical protein
MAKKPKDQIFDFLIDDLKAAHGNASDADKKKIKAAAEFIDSVQMEQTTERNCKVGSTIPE